MNEDIEKYEKQKLDKLKINNPKEYQRLIEEKRLKKKESKKIWLYFVIPLLIMNSILKGPPILYLFIGLIPYIIKKIKPS